MNSIDLAGKTAVVTGGAQGLGLAIARRLASSGAAVCLWDMNLDALEAARSSLPQTSRTRQVDVTNLVGLEVAHASTEDELGPVSLLVNSAGIAGNNAPVENYDPSEWRRVVDVNLTGTFYVNRVVIPSMKRQNYGRIVNISSVAGKEGNPNLAAYSAAKAGVLALTKSLGKELAAFNIAVNAITPATAKTGILQTLKPEFIQYMLDRIPRGRFLEVEEAASMVAWLVSEENSFTTGSVFDLSGGRTTY
ncbi:MAG: SDR family oxidoreductase [Devosia sp.]|uniref:SDR family NAD(P)-dependent oxidoreductase n=1 Tax=Devosia sp. 66-22 TaxID=1895753 RepID=UPI00092857AF|nr:SDR family NAD(P)-dependent oxidoreductase [Devosia sp. 66-22]MBN9347924.1 SDR family oxidoreductase [Devosia sp.]OJX50074.1 MAG: 3-oxoacyl-ACP reductase [Devosia sp. 66-22]